jgi:uncharacterized 2Fe-2S/4Fe-4S cluster protein (DUF4445 family)
LNWHNTSMVAAMRLFSHEQSSILEAIRKAGRLIPAHCGDHGRCGKCKILVVEGDVSPPDDQERQRLTSSEIGQGQRLACRTFFRGPVLIEIASQDLIGAVFPKDELPQHSGIPAPADYVPGHAPWGVAVDLGTTKIAACLVDRRSGRPLDATSAHNPQLAYGSDLMSRLKAALNGQGQILSQLVYAQINAMVRCMCDRNDIAAGRIGAICIVGNTAMMHLLLRQEVASLASAPYRPISVAHTIAKAQEIGLIAAPDAWVYLPAGIGGFVGSDHLAMLIATDLANAEGITLGIDIGTNTEIVLRNSSDNTVACLSTPSGPAFEGAQISCGMLAGEGAITRIRFAEDHFDIECAGSPRGICGSGLVQATAECYRQGIVNHRGRIVGHGKCIYEYATDKAIVLVWSAENSKPRLTLTQADLNALLLAKGSVQAGIDLLLEQMRIPAQRLDRCILAGAFGMHLDLESAVAIGMLPPLPRPRFLLAGHAALRGALQLLLCARTRRHSEVLAPNIAHLEINRMDRFKRVFARAIYLPQRPQNRTGGDQ